MTYKTIIQNMVHDKIIDTTRKWFGYSDEWHIRTFEPEDIDLKKFGKGYETPCYMGVEAVNPKTREQRLHGAYVVVWCTGKIDVTVRNA